MAVFLHRLTGSVGVTLGVHRLITHRGFQPPILCARLKATAGSGTQKASTSATALSRNPWQGPARATAWGSAEKRESSTPTPCRRTRTSFAERRLRHR